MDQKLPASTPTKNPTALSKLASEELKRELRLLVIRYRLSPVAAGPSRTGIVSAAILPTY